MFRQNRANQHSYICVLAILFLLLAYEPSADFSKDN